MGDILGLYLWVLVMVLTRHSYSLLQGLYHPLIPRGLKSDFG